MADISDPTVASELVDAVIARFGRLEVLVNNASVRRQTKFSDVTPEEWRDTGRGVPLRPCRGTMDRRGGWRVNRQFERHPPMSAPWGGCTR